MPVIVSLLRGINLGGQRKVKMDDLRVLYESLGLRGVQTFIQSGNVVCHAPARGLAGLPKKLGKAFEERFGFSCDIVVRTVPEMREVLARNPFASRQGLDPAKLLINFLAADPHPDGCTTVRAMDIAPEELHIDGRHMYAYFPNGLARPKMSWPRIVKALGTSATGRNLTTVQKLLALSEKLEAPQ